MYIYSVEYSSIFLQFSTVDGYWNDGSWSGWQTHWAGRNYSAEYDEIRPSDGTCSGRNGHEGSGVNTYITCCDPLDTNVEYSCVGVYGGGYTDLNTFSVECPTNGDYFMSSCSAEYVLLFVCI